MIEAPKPPDEESRLKALRDLGVLFTPAEERFDRITRIAARMLRMPIALVSLVDDEVQWFKSSLGIHATETPRRIAFCGHAILDDETLVVPDARQDLRFHDNPFVVNKPFVRFYAGHPLHAMDGSRVGTLCVMDVRPRRLSPSQLDILRALAGWAENELRMRALSEAQRALIDERDELRRRSMLDTLTRTWNRGAIEEVLARELARAERDGSALSVIMADVDHFKHVNDSFGHPAGDVVLCGVVAGMRTAVRPYDAIGRFGGEEFLVVLPRCDARSARTIAERMRRRVEAEPFETPGGMVTATLSLGVASTGAQPSQDPGRLIESADRALYRAKERGRNQVVVAA